MKTYNSNTKPRFDNKGSLFGDLHRELPSDVCMFDIDRMFARAEIRIKRENEGFVEYRHSENGIIFTALFEVKYKYNKISIDPIVSVNKARQKMAELLKCKLFVVFQNNGKQPLSFYEYKNNNYEFVYKLIYNESNREEKVNECWRIFSLL